MDGAAIVELFCQTGSTITYRYVTTDIPLGTISILRDVWDNGDGAFADLDSVTLTPAFLLSNGAVIKSTESLTLVRPDTDETSVGQLQLKCTDYPILTNPVYLSEIQIIPTDSDGVEYEMELDPVPTSILLLSSLQDNITYTFIHDDTTKN